MRGRFTAPSIARLLLLACCFFYHSDLLLFVKADIEGIPEISMSLSLPSGTAPNGRPTPRVENFILDPRVQATDGTTTKKLNFSPPLGQYPLCTYTVTSLPRLPLRGFYQMKVPGFRLLFGVFIASLMLL